jgi:D-lactate dehydrogenase
MKILVFSAHPYEIPFLITAAKEKHELVFTDKKLSPDTVHLASGCSAVALFTGDDASALVIEKLKELGVKQVALRSAGFDHVDLKAIKKSKISVANVPAYSPYAIAEHAVALLLALNRKLIEGQRLLRLSDFRLNSLVGFDIHGKTVGIIGTGTIGMTFARIMRGFEVSLIAYDPVQNKEASSLGIQYVSLDELFTKSDIISIHCPLNEHTRYLVSAPQLQKIKRGCILINTSRGGIVNTEELLDALQHDLLGGACLDVYEKEKSLFFEDHQGDRVHDDLFLRLMSNPKVIVTGHQAFLTVEALRGISETTIKNLDCWQAGKRSPNELTP